MVVLCKRLAMAVFSLAFAACGYFGSNSDTKAQESGGSATSLRGICSNPAMGICSESIASSPNNAVIMSELCVSATGNAWVADGSCDMSDATAVCELGPDSPMGNLFEKSEIIFGRSISLESARFQCDWNKGNLRQPTKN